MEKIALEEHFRVPDLPHGHYLDEDKYQVSKGAGAWFDGIDLPEATLRKIAQGNATRLLRLDRSPA